jgi:signal transduction histidine kinase
MFKRPRRGALGLRGRIVATVLVTTVATLAVAAVALLGPLEHSLQSAAQKTLSRDLGGAKGSFTNLRLTEAADVHYVNDQQLAEAHREQDKLRAKEAQLAKQIGATIVTLFHWPDSTGASSYPVLLDDSEALPGDSYPDVAVAFRTHRVVRSFGSLDGKQYARETVPIRNKLDGQPYVLAVRKPIDEIPGAVSTVRKAFLYAALAGLVLTVLLAIPLAATLVRRLRRLRESALQVAREGLPVDVPEDRARDEVGDLARTLKIMQQRLRHQEEARRAFVATASHELRTPLTSLDGMLELLDDDLGSGDPDLDDARSLVQRARAQSRRLGRLAADLLDLSRIDAEVRLRSEPVELSELCRAVLAEFEHSLRGTEVATSLDESSGPTWVLADPGSVAQILRILLDNAVRVSPPGSEVTVELRSSPAPALSVRDRGPGVPVNERELIFERFQRGRETGGDAGFGLGLAIGRELAERMSGRLVLADPGGVGATFTLELPAARAPEEDPVAIG